MHRDVDAVRGSVPDLITIVLCVDGATEARDPARDGTRDPALDAGRPPAVLPLVLSLVLLFFFWVLAICALAEP